MDRLNDNVQFFNAVRAAMLEDTTLTWAGRVPEASKENFAKIGLLLTNPANGQMFNEWLSTMLNRIGMTLFRRPKTRNRLSRFFTGTMEWGEFIQETAADLPHAETYLEGKPLNEVPACEPNPFCKVETKTVTHWHERNRKEYYQRTIWPNQLKPAFTGAAGFNTLLDIIISSIYDANAADTYIWTKRVLYEYVSQTTLPLKPTQIITTPAVTDNDSALALIAVLKKAALDMALNSQAYNPAGVVQYTDPSDMVLFIKQDMLPFIQTYTLPGVYHDDYLTSALTGYIPLDDFGDPDSAIIAALVDKDFFMIYQNLQEFTSIYNPKGLYWNYWLHIWETYAASFMKNAVFFVAGNP